MGHWSEKNNQINVSMYKPLLEVSTFFITKLFESLQKTAEEVSLPCIVALLSLISSDKRSFDTYSKSYIVAFVIITVHENI
jgi:hypothetical protein